MNASNLSLRAAAAVLIVGMMGVCNAADIDIVASLDESLSIVSCPNAISNWTLVAGTSNILPDDGEGQSLDPLEIGSNTGWKIMARTDNSTMRSASTGDALDDPLEISVSGGAFRTIGMELVTIITDSRYEELPYGDTLPLPISFRQSVGWDDPAHDDYQIKVTVVIENVV